VRQARFAELEPRSGRELRTLGTLWADEIRQLEIVSSGDRDVISFGVIESFGMEAPEPRPRGSNVVLVSDAAGLRVLGTDAFLGALVSLPEGPTLLAAPDSQLCAESVCLGAPGNRHALRDDGGVTSHTDADRLYAARAWAAVARGDGTWLELGDALRHYDADGRLLATVELPFNFNVFELDGDDTRFVTHTYIEAGPARRLTATVSLPPVVAASELFITWDGATLAPLRYAAVAAAPEVRSGLHTLSVGADGRFYVTGIADPTIDVCGRTFERSIFVIALE